MAFSSNIGKIRINNSLFFVLIFQPIALTFQAIELIFQPIIWILKPFVLIPAIRINILAIVVMLYCHEIDAALCFLLTVPSDRYFENVVCRLHSSCIDISIFEVVHTYLIMDFSRKVDWNRRFSMHSWVIRMFKNCVVHILIFLFPVCSNSFLTGTISI